MDSKLPVPIKKRRLSKDYDKCVCSKFLEMMMGNCQNCEIKKTKLAKSRSSQTKVGFFEKELIQCAEIQKMLNTINDTLATILNSLKERHESMVEIGKETRKSSRHLGVQKSEKFKKKNNVMMIKKHAYGWPDISRIYAHPPWVKHYMQKFYFMAQETVVTRNCNMMYRSRPLSCPNINYIQSFGGFGDRNCFTSLPICRNPLFPFNEQGDFQYRAIENKSVINVPALTFRNVETKTSEHEKEQKVVVN